MKFFGQYELELEAEELSDSIEKAYARFDVNVEVKDWTVAYPRFFFQLKVKGKSRKAHLLAYADDVQRRLKLPVFILEERKFKIILIISKREISYPRLPAVLKRNKELYRMELPYIVGYDTMGVLSFVDLAEAPHLLMGGATFSGKSVGLQVLITSIASIKPPSSVRLILIDVGANDLMPFNRLPHLACPVVREKAAAQCAIAALVNEMKRRSNLEYSNPRKFKLLPQVVLVIDELPALIRGTDKPITDFFVNSINSLLERGRHTRIHVVLAAQNPTQRNIKVDLSNTPARIAFKCSKKNYANTIIEDCGAENLRGQGDLYFSFPGRDLQRLQGAYITAQEIAAITTDISIRWGQPHYMKKFMIPDIAIQKPQNNMESSIPHCVTEELFANIAYYVLGVETVSCNELSKVFRIGWNRASDFIQKLCRMRIVSAADGKLPRRVLLQRFEDVPPEAVELMGRYGIGHDAIRSTIEKRTSNVNQ